MQIVGANTNPFMDGDLGLNARSDGLHTLFQASFTLLSMVLS